MAEVTTPELTAEGLLELKQSELLDMARKEFNYPASVAQKKCNKTKLAEMILAGSYPNETFKEPVKVAEVTTPEDIADDFSKFDMTVPSGARIVFGGPVVKDKSYPFGFTVDRVLSQDELEKYGVGKGVTYHSRQGTSEQRTHTYKIAY